eukprot:gene10864-biopygen7761
MDEHGAMKFPANRLGDVVQKCKEMQDAEDTSAILKCAIRSCGTGRETPQGGDNALENSIENVFEDAVEDALENAPENSLDDSFVVLHH